MTTPPSDYAAPGTLEAGTAARGSLRWVAVDLTGPVEEVRRRLDLSPVAAAALGRALAGAAMLLRLTAKTPQRVTLEVRGDGPLRQVLAEADEEGRLRGTVGEPRATVPDRPDGKLAVGAATGQGLLRVLKEFRGGGRYHSQVALVNGEIGLDLAHYLRQSEQVASAVLVGVLTRPQGVAAAGGLVVEVLPGASEDAVARLEANIARSDGVSRVVDFGGVAAVKAHLLEGLDPRPHETQRLRYHCRCSRERLLRHLVVLTAEDLDPLREEDRSVHAECAFCGASYTFFASELETSGSVS